MLLLTNIQKDKFVVNICTDIPNCSLLSTLVETDTPEMTDTDSQETMFRTGVKKSSSHDNPTSQIPLSNCVIFYIGKILKQLINLVQKKYLEYYIYYGPRRTSVQKKVPQVQGQIRNVAWWC